MDEEKENRSARPAAPELEGVGALCSIQLTRMRIGDNLGQGLGHGKLLIVVLWPLGAHVAQSDAGFPLISRPSAHRQGSV